MKFARVIVVYLIPLHGPLPVFHHRPSYAHKVKSKLSSIKNPRDRHIHKNLSNVVIYMPCVNIHRAGHYQLEMVFLRARLPLNS